MYYDTITDITDDAVYLYQPGWGSSGPNKDWPSFAPLPSAYAGATHEVAGRDNAPVVQVANDDPAQSLLSACGMLMGLLQQQATGDSQYIESPQINASMAHIAHLVRRPDGTVLGAERVDTDQAGVNALNRVYRTRDSWVCLGVATDEETDALAEVTGVDIPTGPRFATEVSPEAEAEMEDEDAALTAELEAYFADRTTDAVLEAFDAAGVPATKPAVPSPLHEFLNDPENYETGRVAECDHPNHDRIRGIDRLVRISDEDRVPLDRGPENSEQKEEILSMLGHEPDEIEQLDEDDVLM
jgi:crotonobetainyl-CoA:carnitine CoA-transferase CaiB-like acyl-CoA transferase